MSRKAASAAMIGLTALLLIPGGAFAQSACPSGNVTYTFNNHCAYDIWLGEFPSSAAPLSNTWQINAGGNSTVCLPTTWNGRFWPRTGCTGSGNTLNCVTGQCGGANQGTAACTVTGNPPGAILEVNTGVNTNPGQISYYDLSLVNGYNVPMAVTVSGSGCNQTNVGCVADLLNSCPTGLQMTVPPTASGDSDLPCGTGTFCPAGQCINNNACLVACFDPGDACLQQASSVIPLQCNLAIPGINPPGISCSGQVLPSVPYLDMYLAKNYSGTDAAGNAYSGDSTTMASPNQGTPTCFANADCPVSAPDCLTSGFPSSYTPPSGAGVCVNLASSGSANSYNGCSQTTSGQPCGGLIGAGFSNALGYTCQNVTYTQTGGSSQTASVCLPSLTNGLGSYSVPTQGTPQYSGVAGVMNAAWMAAALQAGNGQPYYSIFKQACPTAYSWQYDDVASLYTCSTVTSFTVTFCPAQ